MAEQAARPARGKARAFLIFVLVVVIAGIGGCVAGISAFFREDANPPQRLLVYKDPPPRRLEVTATVISIDPVRNAMRVALEFTPRGDLLARNSMHLARDLHIFTDSAQGVSDFSFHAGHQAHPVEVTLSLEDGDIALYPIDRYRASLEIEAWSRAAASAGEEKKPGERAGAHADENEETPVPIALTFIARNHALHAEASLGPGSEEHEINVRIALARPAAVQGFAWFINLLMAMLALCSCIVVYNVAWRGKRLEPNLLVWMSALLFVLPTMRNTLPGVPSLGSLTDFLVFFWVEAVVALCLFLMVLTWYGRVPEK